MKLNGFPLLLAAFAGILLAACGGAGKPAGSQLTYVDADGNIRLVNADGSDSQILADTGNCGRFPRLIWSPTGQGLVCLGSSTNTTDAEGLVVLWDAQGQEVADLSLPGELRLFSWSPSGEAFLCESDGQLLLGSDSGDTLALGPLDLSATYNATPYGGQRFWSPDGLQFAYRRADAAGARLYSLVASDHWVAGDRSLAGDYWPMAWVLGGKALVVATKYQAPVPEGYPAYEASVLDLASGELTRVPELDNGRQFWVSPDGTRAAVLTEGWEGTSGYPGLAMLVFTSLEYKPIRNSIITYGSDHIPAEWVTFTADGSQIYWITQWETGTAIFRANSDATGLVKMAQFESVGTEFSPDLTMVAFRLFDEGTNTLTLYTANIDGTGVHKIDRAESANGGFSFASTWRPTP